MSLHNKLGKKKKKKKKKAGFVVEEEGSDHPIHEEYTKEKISKK